MKNIMRKFLSTLLVVLLCLTAIPLNFNADAYGVIREDVCRCENHIETGYCRCCIYCPNIDTTYILDCCRKNEDGKWRFCCVLCTGLLNCECACDCCMTHNDIIEGEIIPLPSLPENAVVEGCYTYVVFDDKATIVYVDNSISGDVVIPSTLGGYPVTAIDDAAFVECIYMTSVTIPEGVTSIGDSAFAACVSLTEISLPDTVSYIGNGAFYTCLLLKEFDMPVNVEILNEGIFMNCFSLEKLIINNAETNFDKYYICCADYELVNITVDELVEKIKEFVLLLVSGNFEEAEKLETDIFENNFIVTENIELIKTVTIYSHDPSTAKTYAEENGFEFRLISEDDFKENEIITDDNTNVEIEFDNSVFDTEVELIVSEEEANANIVFGNEFENYKAYDISIVADGEKVQPEGYVTVKLPLPEGFNAEATVVYYVDDNGNKTKLESNVENGFVVFETDHFSEYVIVDESSKIEPPHKHSYTSSTTKNPTCTEAGVKTFTCSCNDSYTESIPAIGHKDDNGDYKCDNGCGYEYEKPAPEDPEEKPCDCDCHKGGIAGFFFKLINFFVKIFDKNARVCDCGKAH